MEIVSINKNIFREYDIRGIYLQDLDENVAYTIGKSFGTYIKNYSSQVVVGRDNRISSPIIHKSLVAGIISTGINVIDLGLVTTPMYYYAKKVLKVYTGIMITASHCPKEYNGFKISFSEIGNAYGELITQFRDFTAQGQFIEGQGKVTSYNIREQYINLILSSIDIKNRKKIIFDCGNGTGSVIIKDIVKKLNIEADYLYCYSDPSFPNHHPDPAVKENMVELGQRVKEKHYDLGIGIDGDADRVGIVDENGTFLPADMYMIMIYRNIVNSMKNKKGLFDVKCSKALIDELNKLGIRPDMYRTGNSYTNMKINSEDYDFGGEYSGHVFFRDKFIGIDDGLYAGLRLVEILSKTDQTVSQLLDGINRYYATEETKIPVTEDNKFEIVDEIKKYTIDKGYTTITLDGVRVEFADAWALIRASNTGPNLTVRFEANTSERLEQIKNEFMNKLNEIIASKK